MIGMPHHREKSRTREIENLRRELDEADGVAPDVLELSISRALEFYL
jgi:hypothetical protein